MAKSVMTGRSRCIVIFDLSDHKTIRLRRQQRPPNFGPPGPSSHTTYSSSLVLLSLFIRRSRKTRKRSRKKKKKEKKRTWKKKEKEKKRKDTSRHDAGFDIRPSRGTLQERKERERGQCLIQVLRWELQ